MPTLAAFLLGLLTASSPRPLVTDIAAIRFIGRDTENKKRVFQSSLLHTLGRIPSYTLLDVILIIILKEGSGMLDIQEAIGIWGEFILGLLLFVIDLLMPWGDKLNLPKSGFTGDPEGPVKKGGWNALMIEILFALAFYPTSGVFYFGMLISMSVMTSVGYLLPMIFAVAMATPVLTIAWVPASSIQQMGNSYGKVQKVQKRANLIVGAVFIIIGIYYCQIMHL